MLYSYPKRNVQNIFPNSPIKVSKTDMLSGFQALNLPINLWLLSLLWPTLNLAIFYCEEIALVHPAQLAFTA